MYDERIEQLIDFAFADGEVTEAERELLVKKATDLGINKEEFVLVLDARIFQLKKENNHSIKANSKLICSNCQASIDSHTTECEYCGYDVINKRSNASIKRLFELLTEAESQRTPDPTGLISGLGRIYADAFTQMLGPNKVDRKKMEIISTFPIPTTKDDILEFLALAIPKSKKKGNFFTQHTEVNKLHNLYVPIWREKCEQLIIKSKFSMKNDKQTLNEILKYASDLGIN